MDHLFWSSAGDFSHDFDEIDDYNGGPASEQGSGLLDKIDQEIEEEENFTLEEAKGETQCQAKA